jgi:hypothetical protein
VAVAVLAAPPVGHAAIENAAIEHAAIGHAAIQGPSFAVVCDADFAAIARAPEMIIVTIVLS